MITCSAREGVPSETRRIEGRVRDLKSTVPRHVDGVGTGPRELPRVDPGDVDSGREDRQEVERARCSTGRRRSFSWLLLGVLLTACGSMVAWAPHAAAHGATDGTPVAAEWGYHGDEGPAHWGDLHPAYAECSQGQAQSPVDITNPVPGDLPDITFAEGVLSPIEIINTGETIEISAPSGIVTSLDGIAYELVQFHFHSPSEHTHDGIPQAMELHLVHSDPDGNLLVIAVFLTEGAEHAALRTIFDNMPATPGQVRVVEGAVAPGDLLPTDKSTYRYHGSLTTPPCSEGVQWIVLTQPVEVSIEQIDAFRALYPENARPLQPLNEREIEGQ